MHKLVAGFAMSLLCNAAVASDNILLQVKVFDGSQVIHNSQLRAVIGEESSMEVGTEIPYDTQVTVTKDGKTGITSTESDRSYIFDGIRLKVTPTQANDRDAVYLTTDVRITKFEGFRPFKSAGVTMQLPRSTNYATRQKPHVVLGRTYVMQERNDSRSFRVELTPMRAEEKSFQVE